MGKTLENLESAAAEHMPENFDDVPGFFSGLFDRFKNACSVASQGETWKQKIILFWAALTSNVENLSLEDQKIKQETAKKAGKVLMEIHNYELTKTVEKGMMGSQAETLDAPSKTVVRDFALAGVTTGKDLGEEKFGQVSSAFDIVADPTSKEKLSAAEKASLIAFGLQTIASLKKHPSYNSVDKLTTALDKFDNATKTGKGIQTLRNANLASLLTFNEKNPTDLLIMIRFSGLVDVGDISKIERKLTAAPLDYNEALKLQDDFKKLFPSTSKEGRAQALVILNKIFLSNAFPSNRQIAELAFALETSDIEKLSNILSR